MDMAMNMMCISEVWTKTGEQCAVYPVPQRVVQNVFISYLCFVWVFGPGSSCGNVFPFDTEMWTLDGIIVRLILYAETRTRVSKLRVIQGRHFLSVQWRYSVACSQRFLTKRSQF
eukprot:6175716-Pleurochrysis_carterae.AAC.4